MRFSLFMVSTAVDRHPDGAGLVGDGAGDGLPYPPGSVGGELVAQTIVELLHRPDEAQVAFLDEIQEHETPAHVALGDGDDQAQIGFGEPPLGFHILLLDQPGQLDLLLGSEQGDPADLAQVHAHRVVDGVVDGDVEQLEKLLLLGEVLQVLHLEIPYLHPHLAQKRVDELEFLGGQVGVLHKRAHLVQRQGPERAAPARGSPAAPRR